MSDISPLIPSLSGDALVLFQQFPGLQITRNEIAEVLADPVLRTDMDYEDHGDYAVITEGEYALRNASDIRRYSEVFRSLNEIDATVLGLEGGSEVEVLFGGVHLSKLYSEEGKNDFRSTLIHEGYHVRDLYVEKLARNNNRFEMDLSHPFLQAYDEEVVAVNEALIAIDDSIWRKLFIQNLAYFSQTPKLPDDDSLRVRHALYATWLRCICEFRANLHEFAYIFNKGFDQFSDEEKQKTWSMLGRTCDLIVQRLKSVPGHTEFVKEICGPLLEDSDLKEAFLEKVPLESYGELEKILQS